MRKLRTLGGRGSCDRDKDANEMEVLRLPGMAAVAGKSRRDGSVYTVWSEPGAGHKTGAEAGGWDQAYLGLGR